MKKSYSENAKMERDLSILANSGGVVRTKVIPDWNTGAMGLDPAKVRKIPRGFADEVPHADKEIVSTANVISGNYHPSAATKYDDFESPTITSQDPHIPIK